MDKKEALKQIKAGELSLVDVDKELEE